jgi:hypothetical protein
MVAGAEDWAMEALGDMGIDDQRIDGSFFFWFFFTHIILTSLYHYLASDRPSTMSSPFSVGSVTSNLRVKPRWAQIYIFQISFMAQSLHQS